MSYTKQTNRGLIPEINGQDTFDSKCKAFRQALFLKPPPDNPLPTRWASYSVNPQWNWTPLSKEELTLACSDSIVKGKTPGPDGITQEIINKAYNAILDTFLKVYSLLIARGHHPRCWRRAIGVTLSKPGKPDYTILKAYRVISLLNCLGKVTERILAKRLGVMAETGPLLHNSQLGGRKKKSAVDTALLLTNYVEQNRKMNKKTSAVFLDVKGAFNHVAKNRLLRTMIKLKLPYSLVSWTRSFLENRLLRITFDGQIEEEQEIETGVLQGSPISPILFLIYIRDLFQPLQDVVPLLYIDDIGLLTCSTSLKKNARILQREVRRITELGN